MTISVLLGLFLSSFAIGHPPVRTCLRSIGRFERFRVLRSPILRVHARQATTTRIGEEAVCCYIPDILPREVFERLRGECTRLKPRFQSEDGSFAVGRKGIALDSTNEIAKIMADTISKKVNDVTSSRSFLADFPIELRSYSPGSRMDWHVDDVLYAKPQCEAILTVEQSSDSKTEWVDINGEVTSVRTLPNSLLLIKAGCVRHRVTPLTT